jgi:uncharacterized protein YyaL (SSP411 family)
MADPTRRNRLDDAASPYLQQHADNPVHWQPWDDAALEAARDRDVPIFLSVGYSACHWCHVMAGESFENDEVAAVLNEEFVPVKVDREERPDLDSVYQTVCQLVTRRGGWPLSVWLTPDGRPFYVGTYFPKEPKRGQPGFLALLEDIAESWETERDDLEERADEWAAAVENELESVPEPDGPPGADALAAAGEAALRSADREHGGFGSAPKFPNPQRVELLFRAFDRTGRDAFRDVATEALDAMAAGGIYDHVGGGFHRYATDEDWTVPHFEKMLYDNAELPRAYLAGYRVTGRERYADVVRETLEFVDRELGHPEGGFYSTLDAQSETESGEREEGAFYVWTPEGVEAALDGLDADLFRDRYGVDDAGNFEGRTVLTGSASVADLADEYDLDEAEVERRLAAAREQAFEARAERPRPRRDEKVLAGWNGLAISAFAEAGLALDPGYADRAAAALAFVREYLWDGDDGRLHRRFKDGDAGIPGYLADYAFLARGALDCYQATGTVEHLAFAVDLARVIEAEFWDEDDGTLYFTPAGGDPPVARPQELRDQSTPSSAGVAARVLLALDGFAPHDRFGDAAEGVLSTHAESVEGNPLQHATLSLAADDLAVGPLEVTVAADRLPDDWRERVGGAYLPGRILSLRPPRDDALAPWLDRLGLDDAPPIWAGRDARDGEPTLYVCRARTCSPPVRDVSEALDWADDLAP